MLPQNKELFDICNITKWHEKGYKGKGLKIAIMDTPFADTQEVRELFNHTIHFVNGFENRSSRKYSHGSSTGYVFQETLPEAEKFFMSTSVDNMYWCIENGIDIINMSMRLPGGNSEDRNIASQKAKEAGIILGTSAGNEDEEWMLAIPARLKPWMAVGAVRLMGPNWGGERIVRADYSSYTRDERHIKEMVEVMGFAGVHIKSLSNLNRTYPFNGTSCACPFFLSLVGFLKMVKKDINMWWLRDYIPDSVIDLESPGYNKETGWGLFKLSDPDRFKKEHVDEGGFNVSEKAKFKDIPKGHTHEEDIKEAVEDGVLHGFGDNIFKPDEPITRGQMASLYVRMKKVFNN